MFRNSHKRLFDNQQHAYILKGLRSDSIPEPPVAVYLNGASLGDFQGVEMFERFDATSMHPQTVADLVANTYFRLTYQKPDGCTGTFGTSVVGAVSFRPRGEELFLIPKVERAELHTGVPHRLRISIFGSYDGMAEIISQRTYDVIACSGKTCAKVEVRFKALADIELDPCTIGNDAFRLFSLSSMYSAPDLYDANRIEWGVEGYDRCLDLKAQAYRGRYLIERATPTCRLALRKEAGSKAFRGTPGAVDSPSIEAALNSCSIPTEQLSAKAFLAESTNVNDDSLSSWIEWTGAPRVIRKNQEISWRADFRATSGS